MVDKALMLFQAEPAGVELLLFTKQFYTAILDVCPLTRFCDC